MKWLCWTSNDLDDRYAAFPENIDGSKDDDIKKAFARNGFLYKVMVENADMLFAEENEKLVIWIFDNATKDVTNLNNEIFFEPVSK